MTDLMDVGHVVVGTLDRVVSRRFADPDITAVGSIGGRIRPGSSLVAHQPITTEPQVADIGDIVGGLCEGDVCHSAPGGQRADDAVFLIARQRVDGLVFVVGAVVGREVRSVRLDKAVSQLGRAVERPIDARPIRT